MTTGLLPTTTISFSGKDRTKWLQGMVTNDVRLTSEHKGIESFVVDVKGRTLAHGWIFSTGDALYFVSLGEGQAEKLIAHWDRYIIREDVVVEDSSPKWRWYLEQRAKLPESITNTITDIKDLVIEQPVLESDSAVAILQNVILTNDILGAEYVLSGFLRIDSEPSGSPIELQSQSTLDINEFSRLRVESLLPVGGIDFDDKNLPQELDRDAKAISFKKGCYLGQETIARLDALGSVQKKLVPLTIELNNSDATIAPTAESLAGLTLCQGEKEIGQTTSVASSSKPNQWLALGYVRRAAFPLGTSLTIKDLDGVKVTVGIPK